MGVKLSIKSSKQSLMMLSNISGYTQILGVMRNQKLNNIIMKNHKQVQNRTEAGGTCKIVTAVRLARGWYSCDGSVQSGIQWKDQRLSEDVWCCGQSSPQTHEEPVCSVLGSSTRFTLDPRQQSISDEMSKQYSKQTGPKTL